MCSKIIRVLSVADDVLYEDLNLPVSGRFNKIKDTTTLKIALKELRCVTYNNDIEENVQTIYDLMGDTEAEASKTNNLRMKLDMRIMLMKNEKYLMEGSTCEYAKKATSYKLFKDRAVLSVIHLKDHGLYVVEDLVKFYFPTTKSHLKTGHLQKLIMAFSLIKHLLHTAKDTIEQGRADHDNNQMDNIIESEKTRKAFKGRLDNGRPFGT
ncbi:hypothetical protein HPULCUR_007501 [Helicostylum pulchrum]|uniref:Uncharacterized protein n=1 Tax=Helicostylum pulchrum TaxID=562976 RepID=A0ABP9Y4X7_9FUNG